MKYRVMMVMMMMVMVTVSMAAEDTIPSCASKLSGCLDFMNSTSPPSTCCTPLKAAIEKELDCLCNLYNTPGLLKSAGIDVNQARQLPAHCKLTSDLSACSNSSAPSPKSSALSPPPVPGNDSSPKTAFSAVLLLLFLASTII